MQLRKFTQEGIDQFKIILKERRSYANLYEDERATLLQDLRFSCPVDDSIHLNEDESLETREDVGRYLYEKLERKTDDELKDKFLWSWLTLFFFKQLCGEKVQKGEEYYIPDFTKHTRYYKHFLWGPFSIYRQHHRCLDNALAVLCSPANAGNDIVEQIAGRQDLITCETVLEAVTKMYVDRTTRSLKKGFAGKKGSGNVRRLAHVLMQFDVTYDLHQIKADDLIRMLPKEFDRFKS